MDKINIMLTAGIVFAICLIALFLDSFGSLLYALFRNKCSSHHIKRRPKQHRPHPQEPVQEDQKEELLPPLDDNPFH